MKGLLREVVALAWPAVLQGLVVTAVLFTDRLLLGRYSTEALGSMAVSGPLMWSLVSVFGAYSAGIVAVVGRAVGAQDTPRAHATLQAVLRFAAVVGIVVGGISWVCRAEIVDVLIGNEPSLATRESATDYLAVVMMAVPLQFVAAAGSTALQASGDTRTPMWIGALAGGLNLVLTWLLIYGHAGLPELGVVGAAVGTATAFAVQMSGTLWVLRVRREAPNLRVVVRQEGVLKRVLNIATPAFGEKVVYHTAYLVFVALIGRLGDVAMAAHQTLIAIESVSFIAASGFGVAAGALVAQKLGAGATQDAERVGWMSTGLGTVCLSVVGVVFVVWPQACVRIFTDDEAVIELGALCLRVAAIAQPLMAITDALAGALRGAGDTVTPLRAALLGPVLVRLTMCWILAYPLGLGLVGIWIGSTMDWTVRAVWLAWVFKRGRWMRDPSIIK